MLIHSPASSCLSPGWQVICLWSVPAAPIPRARGSKGLWQLSWTPAVFHSPPLRGTYQTDQARWRGGKWKDKGRVCPMSLVVVFWIVLMYFVALHPNTWSKPLWWVSWCLYTPLTNVEGSCVIKTQNQGYPIIHSRSNAAEFTPATYISWYKSPQNGFGSKFTGEKREGGRMSRKHP